MLDSFPCSQPKAKNPVGVKGPRSDTKGICSFFCVVRKEGRERGEGRGEKERRGKRRINGAR